MSPVQISINTDSIAQPLDQEILTNRIALHCQGLNPLVNPQQVANNTTRKIMDGITDRELDELTAGIAANMVDIHPDYAILGGRILMHRLHKQLDIPNTSFVQNLGKLYNHHIHGQRSTRVSNDVYNFALRQAQTLEKIINYDRDLQDYDYFAVQGFMRRGLERIDGEIAEVPSQMFLRVAIGLNVYQDRDPKELEAFQQFAGFIPSFDRLKNMSDPDRLSNIQEYYELLSKRELSLPGPIIMHAGSQKNQMASCFLEHCTDSLTEEEYPISGKVGGIMKALTQLAKQSQGGAGTAVAFHEIRSAGSPIHSSNGKSNGILPFMKMFDATIGAVNQSGKRAGVCSIYLEPWHADILDFLDAASHFTIEEKRCKNLFYALWANDLFFERLIRDKQEAKWTLFDPAVAKNHLDKPLSDYWGEEFNQKYEYLESLNIGKTIPLMEIWGRVLQLFQTVGMPYIVSKDSMNRKSNQQNIGTIKSSNICTEVALVANNDETAVCVLSSICASRFIDRNQPQQIDFQKLILAARTATRHLNNVIDLQFYPTPETRNACLTRRAIGIGCQGLADVFHTLRLEFTSDQAKNLNKQIYEAIYFGCLWESMELAKKEGSYHGFEGSPTSKGILQYDMWGISEDELFLNQPSTKLPLLSQFGDKPWTQLKQMIRMYGLRNSEVTAIAPTANASIRMSQNEMHEPYTRNIYVRQYIGGSIQVVNKYLVQELLELKLWTPDLYKQILYKDGSVQGIAGIPQDIQKRYQTAYELPWKDLTDMMADRSAFVSQSGSFNHYTSYQEASPTLFTQKILYAWRKGLKSISYYMHTETASTAKKELGGFGSQTPTTNLNPSTENTQPGLDEGAVCNMDPDCEFCST